MWVGPLRVTETKHMSYVPRSSDLPLGRDRLHVAARTAAETLRGVAHRLRIASFWVAILLPAVYVPLLTGGLGGRETLVFATLVAVNAGAFVAGHGYDPADAG